MAVSSGWVGRVLAQPLFCGTNLHMHILNHACMESKIVATLKLYHPGKATQGNNSALYIAILS